MRNDGMITSIQNTQVKQWNKLKLRKHRENNDQFLIEGFHLVEEAYKSGWNIDQLIYNKEIEEQLPEWSGQMNKVAVNERVFKEISQTVRPQGIAAVVHMKQWQHVENDYVLLLDAIQDPGNLGTIIRTADAAGFSKVVLGQGTVDLYKDRKS